MQKSTFNISKMDCASEEQLVRMRLEGFESVKSMSFDVPNRKVQVFHTGDVEPIRKAIDSLRLDAELVTTEDAGEQRPAADPAAERRLLWQVLAINFFFFALELIAGFIADSMGLVGDSLDMLADSLVYGLALFAVGGTVARKKKIARASGYFQLALALFGFAEVVRRFLGYEDAPVFQLMIAISLLALAGNAIALYLLQKNKNEDAHMQASLIFTSNDVIINIGVIVAGVLVYLTDSKYPDLIVGMIIFGIVARGAYRKLQLAKPDQHSPETV